MTALRIKMPQQQAIPQYFTKQGLKSIECCGDGRKVDLLRFTTLTPAGSNSNVKTEGRRLRGNETFRFSNKPLEGSTGLYLVE